MCRSFLRGYAGSADEAARHERTTRKDTGHHGDRRLSSPVAAA